MTDQTTPTTFGAVVLELAEERGVNLDEQVMEPEHAEELRSHLDGVEPEGLSPTFGQAAAAMLGLDPEKAEHGKECVALARSYIYGDRLSRPA